MEYSYGILELVLKVSFFKKKLKLLRFIQFLNFFYIFEVVVVLKVCEMIHLRLLFLLVWMGGWVELG